MTDTNANPNLPSPEETKAQARAADGAPPPAVDLDAVEQELLREKHEIAVQLAGGDFAHKDRYDRITERLKYVAEARGAHDGLRAHKSKPAGDTQPLLPQHGKGGGKDKG